MYRRQKKIPTILAILILFMGISGVIFLNQRSHDLSSEAQTASNPQDVHFSNVSDTSFAVSWLTPSEGIGKVIVKGNGTSLTYFEDLDTDNVPRPRQTHLVTVKNLKEDTSYDVQIISGDTGCKYDQNCLAFRQKTSNRLPSFSLTAAKGSVVTEDNKPAGDVILYLTIGKSSLLSTKTDSLGLWVISFNNLRTNDLSARPNLRDNDIVQIKGYLSPDKVTEAITDVKSLRQNLTIPPLQIGKSYNLIDLISKKDLLASINKTNTLGIQTQLENTDKSIEILFPLADGDTTSDTQPRFRGIGIPEKQLIITVNSLAPQTGRIVVAQDGTWTWRPPAPLEPGKHNLGISAYDENGNYITLTRSFIVLKSGEQVLGEATASATLTPTQTLTPTVTLVLLPSPTVTLIPISSVTPSLIAISPSPTLVVPPKTGNATSALILLGSGASLLLVGLKLLLFP